MASMYAYLVKFALLSYVYFYAFINKEKIRLSNIKYSIERGRSLLKTVGIGLEKKINAQERLDHADFLFWIYIFNL